MARPYIVVTGGDGGYGNLGDELLLRATKEFYRPLLARYDVVFAMYNPPSGADDGFTYVDERIEGFDALGLEVRDIALLHYYGGGFLNEHWFEAKIRLCRHLLEAGLPIERTAFTGQGVGPLNAERTEELCGIAQGSATFGTRDRTDLLGDVARLTFDDSIALFAHAPRGSLGPDAEIALNLRTESYVGLDSDAAVAFVEALDSSLRDSGTRAFAFGMVENPSHDETAVMTDLLGRAGARSIRARPRPATYEDLAGYLAGCRLTVATSYHVALVSLYVGTPVVALHASEYYRLKFDGLAEVIRSPLLRVVHVDDFDAEAIDHVARVGADERFRDDLQATLADLKDLNTEAHDVIRALL